MFHILFFVLGICQALAVAPSRQDLAICKPWKCINEKIGSTWQANGQLTLDRSTAESYLTNLLPQSEWNDGIQSALNSCFNATKPKIYSSFCPGQEIWHCIVDQLVESCPVRLKNEEKSCTRVSSLLGSKFLFYQNTYTDIDSSAHSDDVPRHFKFTYNSTCCVLPSLFTSSVLEGCGVSTFLKVQNQFTFARSRKPELQQIPTTSTLGFCSQPIESINPYECCDFGDLIKPEIFDTCELHLEWQKEKGIVQIEKEETAADISDANKTQAPVKKHHRELDIKVVPESCSGVACVFKKLGIASASGVVNNDAFSRLLDNMTAEHPAWASARARVSARCLKRELKWEYDGCPVSQLLACVFDVLSENCPRAKKGFADPCRHPSMSSNSTAMCQVSLSKYRRVRHRYCDLPRLVPQTVLQECGLISLSRMETVKKDTVRVVPKKHAFIQTPMCKYTTNETNCALEKMGVMNKYKFMDSLKMKELIDGAISKSPAWAAHKTVLEDALRMMPKYKEYCVSTRKLLNLIDSVISTCPFQKRKYNVKCSNFFRYQSLCTKTTPSRLNATTLLYPLSTYKPLSLNITFMNRTVQLSHIYSPLTHTVSRSPSYATKYTHYLPVSSYSPNRVAFRGTKNPPTRVNSNFAYAPKGIYSGNHFSAVYSPMYSHRYTSRIPGNVKDNFRSNNPSLMRGKSEYKPPALNTLLSEAAIPGQIYV